MYWESGGPGNRYKWPLDATDIAQEQSSEDTAAQEPVSAVRWGGLWHQSAADIVAEDAQGDGGNQQ